jgi:hypothetical protein
MSAWEPSEDEEISVSIYAAIRGGLVKVHEDNAFGEPHYDITPLGMTRARAAAFEYGYDPDDLAEHELFALAAGLVA